MVALYGTPLLHVESGDWEAHLAAEGVEAWYHTPKTYALLRKWHLEGLAKLAAPRGFSRADNNGRPDEGDYIDIPLTIYHLAEKAAAKLEHGDKPTWAEMDAFLVIAHEFSHCHVRGATPEPGEDAAAWEQSRLSEEELYGHPKDALPAIAHAQRTHYGVNAFTGLLRWNKKIPDGIVAATLEWFSGQVAIRQAGV